MYTSLLESLADYIRFKLGKLIENTLYLYNRDQ